MKITRIEPLPAAKVAALIYGIIGLVMGIVITLTPIAGMPLAAPGSAEQQALNRHYIHNMLS